ncbi:MAG: zinc ribbon domain-containing protein [Thermoplasmata archaeon]
MSALTSDEIFGIVVVVVISVALAGVGLILLRRLRLRRDQLRGELSGRREAVSDRAFNRIAMARREAGVLATQGTDVPRARELVGQAQASFDARQFDRAYELAQSAHETLVAARQRPPPPLATSPPAIPGPVPRPPPSSPSVSAAPASTVPSAKIPPHRVESQFQLRLLGDEVARGEADPKLSGRAKRAKVLLGQAQQAFDRGDYAESFRLALKGRREAGGSVETLAPPPSTGTATDLTGGAEGGRPTDPAQTAAAFASSDRCPNCGHPSRSEDAFCRGCGTPRKGSTCPQCGAERLPTDVFCAKCGASFS